MKIFGLLLAAFFCFQELSCFEIPGPHRVQMGPELYRLKKTREGGSKQWSWMGGVRARYDRLTCSSGLYWAIDTMYAHGNASGKTGNGIHTKSTISDFQVEGRIGYSVLAPYINRLQITPYIAYGYFNETNHFKAPSPVHFHYRNQFTYAAWGFVNLYTLSPCFSFGLDIKGAYMLIGNSTISHDRDFDRIKLEIENEWQYEIDIPFNYWGAICQRDFQITLTPFYRLRHYGGKPNYPFDFYETKFQIYGFRMLLNLYF